MDTGGEYTNHSGTKGKIMTFTELCLGSVDAMGVLSHVDI